MGILNKLPWEEGIEGSCCVWCYVCFCFIMSIIWNLICSCEEFIEPWKWEPTEVSDSKVPWYSPCFSGETLVIALLLKELEDWIAFEGDLSDFAKSVKYSNFCSWNWEYSEHLRRGKMSDGDLKKKFKVFTSLGFLLFIYWPWFDSATKGKQWISSFTIQHIWRLQWRAFAQKQSRT